MGVDGAIILDILNLIGRFSSLEWKRSGSQVLISRQTGAIVDALRALRQSRIEGSSMLRAWRFFRPVGAHGFAWKITGERSGVRILDNFQCFIE
jgi:hypothetical protein